MVQKDGFLLDLQAVGDYKKPSNQHNANMAFLYIKVANPKDYNKFFFSDPSILSSDDLQDFKDTAVFFLEYSITVTGILANIPLGKLADLGRSIKDGLESIGTLRQPTYTGIFADQKEALENTLVYQFKDGVDLSMFESDPMKAEIIEIPYPGKAVEDPSMLEVMCAVYDT